MSESLSIIIVLEVISTLAIAYCILHEEKLVAFEDKINQKNITLKVRLE